MRGATALLLGSIMLLAGCVTPVDTATTASTADDLLSVSTQGIFHLADGALAQLDAQAMPQAVGGQYPHGHPAPEPTIGITSDGSVFMTGIIPVANRGAPTIFRSDDKGQTWEMKGPRLPTGHAIPPNTNDPYVYVDPATDRVFMLDLHALVCSTLFWSDDKGETWLGTPFGCGLPFGLHDHQTMVTAKPRALPTVGYENLVYYCVNRVVDSACATSLNGGATFGPLVTVFQGGTTDGDLCGGLTGHLESSGDGIVYLARDYCGDVVIARTMDDGLTWETFVISGAHDPDDHDVDLAVDEEGNVYAFWLSEGLPYLAHSTDQGATWSEPRMVGAPGVTATAFNAVAAGKAGHVAFAYIGTTIEGGYEGKSTGYGGLLGSILGEPEPPEWDGATWNAYVGLVTDALAEDYVIQTVTANDPEDPIARGLCGRTRCHGMTDFIDVQIDVEGRPWASFVDVCTEKCVTDPSVKWDKAVGFAATLVEGPALRGDALALPAILPPPAKA